MVRGLVIIQTLQQSSKQCQVWPGRCSDLSPPAMLWQAPGDLTLSHPASALWDNAAQLRLKQVRCQQPLKGTTVLF